MEEGGEGNCSVRNGDREEGVDGGEGDGESGVGGGVGEGCRGVEEEEVEKKGRWWRNRW